MSNGRAREARLSFSAGRRALAEHDPARALPYFRAAVDVVSPEDRETLSRYLYWLAVALFKLGKLELAIKALASAQKLEPRGYARAFYCRASNEYGMARSSCVEHDDYKAFFSIHARRYLVTVPGRRFTDATEMETVLAVIADAWIRLGKSVDLAKADFAQKLAAFRAVKVLFPAFGRAGFSASVIGGDFGARTNVDASSRCSCGSGLPYCRCCGRIPAPGEPFHG